MYKYNFSKDTENPIYDIFDNKELNNIVKKIFEESVGYIDTIIKSELV